MQVSIYQGWPTSLRRRATFLTVLQQRAISYTRTYKKITPPLTYSRTYLCSATFIVNFTHQHNNNRSLPALCMLLSEISGIPCTEQSSSNRVCIPLLPLKAILSHGC